MSTEPLPTEDRLDEMVENAEPIGETTADASQPSGWKPKLGGDDEGPTKPVTDGEDPHNMAGGGQHGG